MKRVLVLVEGQTEETFVRDTLTAHLAPHGVHPTAVILKTKRIKSGGVFRGGVTSTAQVLGDIRRLIGDTGATCVTTMLDYYALPADFPGMATRPAGDLYKRIAHAEQAFAAAVGDLRFLPHLVLHEYEAWIFSDPYACDWVFEDSAVPAKLAGIARAAGGAERIDEGPTTAPSKRVADVFPGYRKTLHGPMAVEAIGILALRTACPHAAAWLQRLETL
jgi:hypothetical protein